MSGPARLCVRSAHTNTQTHTHRCGVSPETWAHSKGTATPSCPVLSPPGLQMGTHRSWSIADLPPVCGPPGTHPHKVEPQLLQGLQRPLKGSLHWGRGGPQACWAGEGRTRGKLVGSFKTSVEELQAASTLGLGDLRHPLAFWFQSSSFQSQRRGIFKKNS